MASPVQPNGTSAHPKKLVDVAGNAPEDSVALAPRAPQKRPPKKKGPNYNQIHRNPLPLQTHPLPAFHPSNPLSLLRIAYVYLSQLIAPPTSKLPEACAGYFSSETRSVHITNPKHIRILWEMGFFGKGLLSRSEPSWLERETARLKAERGGGGTAEEATGRRREERRQFKLERARLEAERIRRQRAVEEGLEEQESQPVEDALPSVAETDGFRSTLESSSGTKSVSSSSKKADARRKCDAQIASPIASETINHVVNMEPHKDEITPIDDARDTNMDITNHEHLQLSLEEAFFLCYGLGALDIHASPHTSMTSPQASGLATADLLHLFNNHSIFPPTPESSIISPDSPFLLHYVVYHHFRSLGWVVRPGTKFSVDYLLYNRGPVFSHAEFAILIMPSYTDSYWSTPVGRQARKGDDAKSWSWLHCINRVQSQVRKTLVLCYVDVPAPGQDLSVGHDVDEDTEWYVDIGRLLKRYKVREFVVRRWVANRSRD